MNCPNCHQGMAEHVLDGHTGSRITVDMCAGCQAFWFDDRESLQLSPASTLRLFRLIGEGASTERRAMLEVSACPRCGLRLKLVQDFQRTTRFQYRRCPRQHGRFTTFFDFLREKNFLKPMSAAELQDLRRHVGAVNCSNCGGSIDLAKSSACDHCGSALSILDATQADKLVTQLRDADKTTRPVDPTLPLRLEHARRDVAQSFQGFEGTPAWYRDVSSSGLIVAGLQSLSRWLKREN